MIIDPYSVWGLGWGQRGIHYLDKASVLGRPFEPGPWGCAFHLIVFTFLLFPSWQWKSVTYMRIVLGKSEFLASRTCALCWYTVLCPKGFPALPSSFSVFLKSVYSMNLNITNNMWLHVSYKNLIIMQFHFILSFVL